MSQLKIGQYVRNYFETEPNTAVDLNDTVFEEGYIGAFQGHGEYTLVMFDKDTGQPYLGHAYAHHVVAVEDAPDFDDCAYLERLVAHLRLYGYVDADTLNLKVGDTIIGFEDKEIKKGVDDDGDIIRGTERQFRKGIIKEIFTNNAGPRHCQGTYLKITTRSLDRPGGEWYPIDRTFIPRLNTLKNKG